MCHLQLQRPPCGTTTCVLSIQVLWVMEPLYTCRAPHACRLADISSCNFLFRRISTSARSKSMLVVSNWSLCQFARRQMRHNEQLSYRRGSATRYVSKFVHCFTRYGSQNCSTVTVTFKVIGNDATRWATRDHLLK